LSSDNDRVLVLAKRTITICQGLPPVRLPGICWYAMQTRQVISNMLYSIPFHSVPP
jgi:hypothetical protein